MTEESYYPPLTIPSHTRRFTLNYPRSPEAAKAYHRATLQDQTAMRYIQHLHNGRASTFEEVLGTTRKQSLDKGRIRFDIHLLNENRNENEKENYSWIGHVSLKLKGDDFSSLKTDDDKGMKRFDRSNQKERRRYGEFGVFLSSASHRKSILTEAIIPMMDLAFNSPNDPSNPISTSELDSLDRNGFGLSKVFILTHHRNQPMRGFLEKTLGLEELKIDSTELSDTLREGMKREMQSEHRSSVHCLRKEPWIGGKRRELEEKVEEKFGKKG